MPVMSERRVAIVAAVAAGWLALGVVYSGLWVWLVVVDVFVVWVGLSAVIARWIYIKGGSLEKAAQSSAVAFPLIGIAIYGLGYVLAGLPSHVLLALGGDRGALVWILGSVGGFVLFVLLAGYEVIAKGSKL